MKKVHPQTKSWLRLCSCYSVYVVGNDKQLYATVREIAGGRHSACVAFRPQSPEVIQLYHVIAADGCHEEEVFDDSEAWLLVDVAALRQPLPVLQQRPCVLRGGFQMRVSGIGSANGGPASFRKCGSYVEMRVESDCSGEFGMHFDFRFDVCVPQGLFMYTRQRTLCIANWTSGPYTFTLLRHDVLPYFWIFRFQTSLEESFVVYLLSDLVDDVGVIPTVTSRYFRFDMVRSAVVPVTSLCVDESEACADVDKKESKRCDTGTGNRSSIAAPAMTCPRACGLCNATRPSFCEFPPEMVGSWHDDVNVTDAEFQLTTAADRKSVDIVMTVGDVATVKRRFHCIQWEPAAPSSGKRPTHGSSFIFNEFLLFDESKGGCRRRYACVWVLFKSASIIYFGLSESRTWPFTSLPSDPVDCSRFENNARFRVLISRERRDLVTCHLPARTLGNYSVTFGDVTCDSTVAVEPEKRHRLRLTLTDCTSPTPSLLMFDCLDSMLAPPTGDVILVTMFATSSTSGATTPSPALRTVSPADHETKFSNVSLFLTDRRRSTTPLLSPMPTQLFSTPSSSSSPSFFQQDSVYCWLFARSSFPHEFRIFPGSQCNHVVAMSKATRQPSATFVKKRVRWPRLLAADQPVSPTLPEPEIHTSGRTPDSKRLSALSRHTEQNTKTLSLTTKETGQENKKLPVVLGRRKELTDVCNVCFRPTVKRAKKTKTSRG